MRIIRQLHTDATGELRFQNRRIASGAAVSSASYLFRASTLLGQVAGTGADERLITINVNGQRRRADVMKQETLAWTLSFRSPRRLVC